MQWQDRATSTRSRDPEPTKTLGVLLMSSRPPTGVIAPSTYRETIKTSLNWTKKAHTIMMTILCDCGTHLGIIMATNITDNVVHDVKPQQLRHFLNLHVCNLDNNDLFYQYYYKNVLMQQPADFLNLNMGVYS
jgi:hypothetical protein